MVKKRRQQILHVLMNGLSVGNLEKTPQGGLIFYYHNDWLNRAGARPVSLSLPLMDQNYSGNVVYNFFDNLLPDNPQIRGRIQARFQIPVNQPFDLLSSIGRDCIGAIKLIAGKVSEFEKSVKNIF